MAASYIYKAQGDRGKKGIFLTPQEDARSNPIAILPNGQRIPGQFVNTNEGRNQYLFGDAILGQQGVKIEYNGKTIDLEDSNKSYEGNNPFDGWEYRAKGDLGQAGSGGGGGFPSNLAPGNFGFGAYAAYLGGQFPNPTFADFDPVKKVPFQHTDPFEFSQKYGDLSRSEVTKNADLAKQLALDQVSTELEGLKSFAPAASALKRSELSLDNRFNQAQRTNQLKDVFPDLDQRFGDLRSDLNAQRKRAGIYASGRAPDEITDRGLELTARSRAADNASASGFSGLAAARTSDLLSAETRLGLAQYGENLTQSNVAGRENLIGTEAALKLAPTAYSDAGSQIRVTPSVSAASLSQGNLGQLNQLSMLSASQAFAGEVGQQQFKSSQEFARREFNKSGLFNESQVNAGIANSFALGKFQYDVGYAGMLAGAAQTDINANTELAQQAAAGQAAQQSQAAAQQGNTIGAIASGIGNIVGAAPALIGALGLGNSGDGYTGAGAISAGGSTYEPGTNYGGGSGSIFVPTGQTIPSGYRRQKGTSSGGSIAIPIGGGAVNGPSQGPSSNGPSSGGTYAGGSSGGSYNGGSSNEDFGGGGAPSGGDSGGIQRDPGSESDPNVEPPPPPDPNYDPSQEDSGGGDSFAYERSGQLPATQFASATLSNFQKDTGVGVGADEALNLTDKSRSVLSDAGIHYQPSQTASVPAGVDSAGRKLYGDPSKMALTTPEAGNSYVKSFFDTMLPTGVFSKGDTDKLQQIAGVAGSVAFIDKLNTYWQAGDKKAFVNAVAQQFKTPIINSITKDPRDRAGLSSLFSAYNLFENWDRMSAGQKGLGLASLGLHAFHYTTGEDLASKPVIEPTLGADGQVINPGLTVGQTLGLFQQGYNAYALVNNWNDLNTIQKITGGITNAAGIAETAKNFGLLGEGVGGTAVNITGGQLANLGYSSASQYGVGAVVGSSEATVPAGYTTVSQLGNGTKVIAPQANAATTAVGPSTLQAVGAGASIAAGAYQVYQGWGTGGAKGALNGAVGGLAIDAGLYTLGATNPYLFAGIVAVSILGDMIHTGKNAAQVQRDGMRSVLKDSGLADKNYQVTLADGTLADVGIDGHGGRHGITNRDLLTEQHKSYKDLSSYDVDYTNDLDYASSMGGVTLSRLLAGGSATNISQVGGQLGNAAIANIGFGKEMTETNFNKMAANQRAFFSQSGIKSKEDALQLINMAEAQHRLSPTDATTSRQAVSMFFDKDGFKTAQSLMAGRHRGIETIPNTTPPRQTVDVKSPSDGASKLPPGRDVDPGFNLPKGSNLYQGLKNRLSPLRLSKEEIINRNASRYGAAANG